MAPTPQMNDQPMPPGPQGSPEDVMAADAENSAARIDALGEEAPMLEDEVPVKDILSLADDIIATLIALTPADLDEEMVEAAVKEGIPEGEKMLGGKIPSALFAALSALDILGQQFGKGYDFRLQEMVNKAQVKRVQGLVVKMGKDKALKKAMEEATPAPAPEEKPPVMAGDSVSDEEADFAST